MAHFLLAYVMLLYTQRNTHYSKVANLFLYAMA